MTLDIKLAVQVAATLVDPTVFRSDEHRQQCCQLTLLAQRQAVVPVEITPGAMAAFEKLKKPSKKDEFVRICTAFILLSATLALSSNEFPKIARKSKDKVSEIVRDTIQSTGVSLVADKKLAERVLAVMATRAKTEEDAAKATATQKEKAKTFATATTASSPVDVKPQSRAKPTPASVQKNDQTIAPLNQAPCNPTTYVFIPRNKFCYRNTTCQQFWGPERQCRFNTQCRYLHRSYWVHCNASGSVYWLVTPIEDRPPMCPPFIEVEVVAEDDEERRKVLDSLVQSARNQQLFAEFSHQIAEHLRA